ncbi:unnamed protein product [Paramecium pentaurelia]|uniref:ABC transporter domain-containing protein n=1 Tax=Paramecium pentaurelia TaxID=43138 RepID=A0A8S1VVJ2_9CILI|nr:unnamed protein product [Paramecium pentaurelia]
MIGFFAQIVGLFIFLNLNNDDMAMFSQGILLLATYNDGLQLGLRQMINVATQMNSYNRIFEIIDIPTEAPHIQQEDKKFNKFPLNGDIVSENVYMRYRANSDLILKGAGKSSILYAIFRMSEIEDDEDSFIQYQVLKLKIQGQENQEVANLDPFEENNDESILKALEITGLLQNIKQFPKGILTDISDFNSVLSIGQKQLICLTRILLSKMKIFVLDKQQLIQNEKQMIQKQLKDCTLITIAHRLNKITDYDKIMVIYDERVIECDRKFNLLAKSPNSTFIDRNLEFSRLFKNTGNSNAYAIFDIAKIQLSIIEN